MGLRSWRSEKFVTRSERKMLKNPGSDHRAACRGFNRALRRYGQAEGRDEAGRYHDDRQYDEAMDALLEDELSEPDLRCEEARQLLYEELRAVVVDTCDPD